MIKMYGVKFKDIMMLGGKFYIRCCKSEPEPWYRITSQAECLSEIPCDECFELVQVVWYTHIYPDWRRFQ